MKKNKISKMIITLCIFIIFGLSSNVSVKIKYNDNKYKFKYNGFVWVGLDYWSIWKYKSDDTPMEWFNYIKE